MSALENPLRRASAAYAIGLMDTARAFAQPACRRHRRANGCCRLDKVLHAREARPFSAVPDDCLGGRVGTRATLGDVVLQRSRWKQTLVVCRPRPWRTRPSVALGVGVVQSSDEFDIGSSDSSRALARSLACVVNSAHGVGNKLPLFGFGDSRVQTSTRGRQIHAEIPCDDNGEAVDLKQLIALPRKLATAAAAPVIAAAAVAG